MRLYIDKVEGTLNNVVLDDMILTKDLTTTAGSKMLDGYKILFEAELVTRLKEKGYNISGKVNTGEFNLDFLGETSFLKNEENDLQEFNNAMSNILKNEDVVAGLTLEVNGSSIRTAGLNNLVYLKPTYCLVSRFGTIASACSGETVGIMAKESKDCREIFSVISGHDSKDGTSLQDDFCVALKDKKSKKEIKKIAIAKSMLSDIDDDSKKIVDKFIEDAKKINVEIEYLDADELLLAKPVLNVLMSAEVCNNVSRYDGIKYGYRTKNYTSIDELYTNSRTEAFGYLLKSTILYGSDALSTENYLKKYDKALRVRRIISNYVEKVFDEYDAILLPVSSKQKYTRKEIVENKTIAYDESKFTSPTMITGNPTLVIGGVQLIGQKLSEDSLLDFANRYEKEIR